MNLKNSSILNKCTALIIMNLILLSIFSWQFRPSSKDRMQSHYVTSQAISIAISKVKYGLDKGYVGYRKVLNPLLQMQGGGDTGILVLQVNEEIDKALRLTDVASDGFHYMPNLPTWSDFVTTAFFIFGPKAKSVFYLYMMLFIVSILIFIITFRHEPKYLYLSLVTIATFIVIINAPAVVAMTRVCHRFWPYLAIMPTLYIAILFADKHYLTKWKFIGALIQALILVFIIHVRNVAIYSFIFLFIAMPLYMFIRHLIKSEVNKSFIQKISVWPLAILLVCFIGMNIYKQIKLYPDYSNINTGYPFWHMIYVSLAAHPDACAKYDICKFSDAVAYKFVGEKMGRPLDGRLFNDLAIGKNPKDTDFVVFFSPIYGKILKDEVIRILKNDPWFFVSSFYYKIILFPSVYLNGSDDIGGYISSTHPMDNNFIPQFNMGWFMRWFLIAMVVAAFFLAKSSHINWHGNFSIVFSMFLSAFIMLLFAYPHYSTIMDPSFTLTTMMFIAISILFYNVYYFTMMMQKYAVNRIKK